MNDLRHVPLFSSLEPEVLVALQARLRLRRYRKGEIVIREGAIGDSMYIIRSGQVQVLSEARGGLPETIITHLGPGAPVGELAALLAERRSATVRVVIDAELWELRKDDLEELVMEYPPLGLAISRELAVRLRRTTRQPSERDTINLIAAMGTGIPTLAQHLQRVTGERVMLLDLGGLCTQPAAPPGLVTVEELALDTEPEELVSRLGEVVSQFDRVIMALPREETALTRKAAEQAEIIVEVGGGTTKWVRRFARDDTYWYHSSENGSIPKIARRIARKRVGLALSSGNARSLAHLGVLRVLEREGIPIDMISGTSGGGLFGGLYALGRSVDEIAAFGRGLADLYSLRSLTAFNLIPRMGLVRGQRVQRVLDKVFGTLTFEETHIPLRIVAADVITGEQVVFQSGPLAPAVRATVSSVPIFEPVLIGDRWLVDGATVNPVPASVLRDHVDIVIACSVIVPLPERIHRKTGRLPNLLGLFLGKEEIMEAGLIQNRLGQVEALIEPNVTNFEGFDFHRADEFIRAGIEATERVIPTLKSVLEPTTKR